MIDNPREELPEYLSATPKEGPCDGTHGLFCPECAAINRWRDRDETRQ